jgi:signal transduction histidine kinase
VLEIKVKQISQGEDQSIIMVIKDLTEALELSNAKASKRLMMMFYTSTTHELRTPLNGKQSF